MTYELALISVLIGAGYWGLFFVRRRPHGTATFGLMQLAAAALAGLGLIGRKYEVPALGIAGAIGVGAGTCLLVLGPIVRVLARRFAAAERIGIATRLLDIAEILAPGSGVAEEKALLGAMKEIREGRIEQTVDALTAAKERAPADARLAIDERIAMLYLASYRWSDAIAHAEAHLFGAPPPVEGEGSLRSALGIAPPVWVELLGAYGRTGDLDRAATMLARLEDVCADRADAALWIHRARVMFLALAGRTDAVRTLVAPRRARHMSAAARNYWVAVAHEHKGDRAAAIAAYEKARGGSRGRPRELIDQALAKLAEPNELPAPATTPLADEVISRVEAAPLPAPVRLPRTKGPWATWTLAVATLATSAVIALAVGEIADIGSVIRAGATVRGLIDAGEWWRLVANIFVHVGVLHLLLNVIGLFIIGRLAEELFGPVRTIALFAVSGIAGAVASYLASPVGISAGASGAVFGLLGAVFVEITWHRKRYRSAWKRGMWGGLAVVTVAQLGYGFLYPVIDQWAHAAGLVAGALFALVLSPHAKWAAIGKQLGRAIALMFAAFAATAAVLVARTSLADSFERTPWERRTIDDIAITAPASWKIEHGELFEPDGVVILRAVRQARGSPAAQIAMFIAAEGRQGKDELGDLETQPDHVIQLPDGWEGSELVAAPEDAMGYHQKLRLVICGKAFGESMILVEIQVPDSMARAAPQILARLIASIGPA